MSIIVIKDSFGIPKYKQIIKSIEEAILNGVSVRGDKLPSINSVKLRFSISRDTVLLAYHDLKSRGIIHSVPGKGYYIKTENVSTSQKIFLLFDEFNSFKEDLYNSFLANLDEGVEVDIYFHHFNYQIFSKLIYDNIGLYNSYAIMPANLKNTNQVLEKLPQERIYILDQTHHEISKYPSVHQNFKKDIINGLTEATPYLKKYKKIILLFKKEKEPIEMLHGFEEFCNTHNISYEIIKSIEERKISKGEVYLISDDRSLILIIKKIKEKKILLSKDIGVISYNDTLLKEIVENGITTISTDFNQMGITLAKMIMNKEKEKIENPNKLIIRKSL